MLKHPAVPYVAPFVTFLALLAIEKYLPFGPEWAYPLRVVVVSAVILVFSRGVFDLRMKAPVGTLLVGVAVFAIWIGPEALWPGYRDHWLFQNSVLGKLNTAPDYLKSHVPFIVFRAFGCAVLVPILEEIFWRGWLARWLIDSQDFRRVPLGAYTLSSFAIGSLFFASEHGPYWEVGLIAGAAYNWWMMRTRSLADCIWAHGITNACLSAYVLKTGQWHYWL